jgi:hypothetical protein
MSKLIFSPHLIGIGESGVAFAGTIDAMEINPAGLYTEDPIEVSSVYKSWYEGFHMASISSGVKIAEAHCIGIFIPYLVKTKISSLDEYGYPVGTYNYNILSPGIYYSYNFRKTIYLGAGTECAMQFVRDEFLALPSLSLGAIASFTTINIGASLTDIWMPIKDGDNQFNSSYKINFGLLLKFQNAEASIQHSYINESGHQLMAGIQYEILKTADFRAGYVYKFSGKENILNGMRVGLGLKFNSILIDYSAAYSREFGITSAIGINIKLFRNFSRKEETL